MTSAMPLEPDTASGPLALICGGGSFPFVVAQSAIRAGRRVVLFAIRGFADPVEVAKFEHEWLALGALGSAMAKIRRHGCRQIVIVGIVMRPDIRRIHLDWTTIRLIPRILHAFRGGDDHLLSNLASFMEEQGFELLGAHQVAPDILVPSGTLGRIAPKPADLDDARLGLKLVRALGPFDVGQGVVVAKRHVQAVEAAEGTDWMLQRCRELRDSGRSKLPPRTGVFVKAPKPGQDRRIDLPSIGIRTVELAAEAGLAGIAVEAGGVIALEVEAMIREADARGLFLIGLSE